MYTECTKHLPNIELHPLLPSEQPQFVRAWTLRGVESVPQGCWPMSTSIVQCCVKLPVCPSGGGPSLTHTWETVECEKPSSIAVLDRLKSVHLAPTTIPRSKALTFYVLPIHPLNGTHTQSMS